MKSRSQGEATGRALALLLLGYFVVAVAVIVLAPFRFAVPDRLAASLFGPASGRLSDLLLNVVLFVPLGFLVDRLRGGQTPAWRIGAIAAAVSIGLETTQLFLPDRYTTGTDVVANTSGAMLGTVASGVLRRTIGDGARMVGRLFLDLPLVGFVWLLVPLVWSATLAGVPAAWLLCSATAAAAVALAAAGRSTAAKDHPVGWHLVPLAAGWLAVALLPMALVAPRWAAVAVVVHLVALPIADLVFRLLQREDRRIEPRAVWLVVAALLPMLLGAATLGAIPGLAGGQADGRRALLGWLAGVAAFTIVGYLGAEARGRSPLGWPRIGLWPACAAVLLAVIADPAVPALRVRMLVGALAAIFGALLFTVQRAHVIALRLAHGGPMPPGSSVDASAVAVPEDTAAGMQGR